MKTFIAIFSSILFYNVSPSFASSWDNDLVRRQAENPNCTSQYQDLLSAVSTSCGQTTASADPNDASACTCTDDISSKWSTYLRCTVDNGDSRDGAQLIITEVTDECQQSGHPFKTPPSLSSGSSGSGGSSHSSSASSGSASASSPGSTSTGSSQKPSGAAQLKVIRAAAVTLALSCATSIILSA